MIRLLPGFLLLFLAACPEFEAAPPATCVKALDKCKLPSGPLGVCQEIACKAGEKAPCLTCISQH